MMKHAYRMQNRISAWRSVFNLCTIYVVSTLINFFPDKVGVLVSATDPSSFIPLLASEFQAHLFWLNLWWVPAFALHFVNLCIRQWTTTTRRVGLALNLLGVFVMGRMALGGPLVVVPAVDAGLKVVLALALVVTLFKAVRELGWLGQRGLTVSPARATNSAAKMR